MKKIKGIDIEKRFYFLNNRFSKIMDEINFLIGIVNMLKHDIYVGILDYKPITKNVCNNKIKIKVIGYKKKGKKDVVLKKIKKNPVRVRI